MALRDSMSTEELLAVGFTISPADKTVAENKKRNAWRYKCEKCGKWNRERDENECPGCRQLENLEAKLKADK
jgi:rRNA maturation endonuclease Nob1